jgi:bifunctional DNA-binding transcriptional regulator/antitoxin component of YhaV-PrlF toxin-antitoxin module
MSRLSAKNQITVPVEVLRATGLRPGDEIVVRAAGPGRVELERAQDLLARYAGALRYPPGHLDALRDEWAR